MALDIARGLPLARLCYYDAIGDAHRLAHLVEQAQAASPEDQVCVRDGFTMALILTFRSLTGRMSRRDRLRWHQWNRSNRAGMKDLIRAWDDPWVWPVHIVSEVKLGLRKLFNLAKIRLGVGGASRMHTGYRTGRHRGCRPLWPLACGQSVGGQYRLQDFRDAHGLLVGHSDGGAGALSQILLLRHEYRCARARLWLFRMERGTRP